MHLSVSRRNAPWIIQEASMQWLHLLAPSLITYICPHMFVLQDGQQKTSWWKILIQEKGFKMTHGKSAMHSSVSIILKRYHYTINDVHNWSNLKWIMLCCLHELLGLKGHKMMKRRMRRSQALLDPVSPSRTCSMRWRRSAVSPVAAKRSDRSYETSCVQSHSEHPDRYLK